MTQPYHDAPGYRRWRQAMSGRLPDEIEPFPGKPFAIGLDDAIMTAGSCFAQHLSRHLKARAMTLVDTEQAHPILSDKTATEHGYGVFSARYGNIYTARQLLQLLRRACGRFAPVDQAWQDGERFFDPFRPTIQPHGFASRLELDLDRTQHLRAVRRAFEQMDVLIFTLGLTECWLDRRDGAVYPICPGTAAGCFDEAIHGFVNFTSAHVIADMTAFIDELRQINPDARIMLTVSPVPMVATALDQHVLLSNTLSKSSLRVAAEALAQIEGVHYFPAYEIVTCGGTGTSWFTDDRRGISEAGIAHVMQLFFQHVVPTSSKPATLDPSTPCEGGDAFAQRMRHIVDALCDEEHLDPRSIPQR